MDAPAAAAPAPDVSDSFDFAPTQAAPDTAGSNVPPPATDGGSTALPILTPSDSRGRRMIYNVILHLQTTEFEPGDRALIETVSEMGGFIVSAHLQGHNMHAPGNERVATYVFRLPTEQLAEFIVVMKDTYNLWELRQTADDVTTGYAHGDLTLSDLREEEAWLREALENPELEESEKRALESLLSDVLALIRSIGAQMSTMDDNILYSTITIYLYEVIFIEIEEPEEPVELTFGERFIDAASRSWAGFVAFCQGFVIVFIRALPVLLILGAITFVIVLIIRASIKRNKARPKQQTAGAPGFTGYPNWHVNANQGAVAPNRAPAAPNQVYNDPQKINSNPDVNKPNADANEKDPDKSNGDEAE
jgi:hypothetical protein